jgi:hypothetical protein
MGNPIGVIIPALALVSLAYWNYRQAKPNGIWAWSRAFIPIGAVGIFAGIFLPAYGESLYKDPAGAFAVTVPANWQTHREAGSPMVSFVNEKSQASVSVGVIHGNEANTPSADKELEMIQSQFHENCPQAKTKERGPTTLGGISGVFLLVNCTSSKGGLEVMKFAVASKPGMLLVLNSASPGPNYEAVLPAFNSMEHSLKLLASTGTDSSAPMHSGSGMYQDPQGRYSLAVPDGWSATPQADSGSLQLSFGSSWAMVIAASGSDPVDVNHQVAQQIQSQFHDFKLLNEGNLQVNGHASHGTTATGVNPKGMRVSVLVLSISAGSGHFLTVISSSPNDQAKTINATVVQMAQSIRFAGE